MRVDEEVPCVLDAKQLTDDELIVRMKRCVAHDRQLTARLLEHFGELDARGLYRDQGYPSMFHYAVHSLRTAVPVAPTEGASANDVAQAPAATVAVSGDEAAVRPGESSGLGTFELAEVGAERMRESNAPAQGRSPRSSYIPRAVRREVMARDGYQCTFMGLEGNRCPERGRLQLDHYPVPARCGGPATTANLRVRCAAHNLLAAEHFYGRDKVLHEIAAARARVSVSKSETLHVPERAAVDVGSPRRETTRTLRAETSSLPRRHDFRPITARGHAYERCDESKDVYVKVSLVSVPRSRLPSLARAGLDP